MIAASIGLAFEAGEEAVDGIVATDAAPDDTRYVIICYFAKIVFMA